MVNLVVVSHSALLAQGVAELAQQMTQGGCQLAVAAGVDDVDHPIGTDAIKVMEAIESVYSPSGVLVLMDLGSALLSAETALELLDPEMIKNVQLCAAPLVEGTVSSWPLAFSPLPAGAGVSAAWVGDQLVLPATNMARGKDFNRLISGSGTRKYLSLDIP